MKHFTVIAVFAAIFGALLSLGCFERHSVAGKPPGGNGPAVAPVVASAPVELPPAGPKLSKAGFACKLELLTAIPTFKGGGPAQKIKVRIANQSAETWPNAQPDKSAHNSVNLAYHWQDAAGQDIKDGDRTLLPSPLAPGQTLELEMVIRPLDEGGNFVLKIEPVQEYVAWFSTAGGCSAKTPVTIAK